MTRAEVYYFIGKCLTMDDDPESRRFAEATILSDDMSWELFVLTSSAHRVLQAVYTAFRRNSLLPLLPAELDAHLENIYDLNFLRNRKIIEQSSEIIHLFENKGIEPIFLKGVGHLLDGMYHDPGDRLISDIDILVPEQNLSKAEQALFEIGYFHPEELDPKDYKKHHHLAGFVHSNYNVEIELHRAAISNRYRDMLPPDEIFAQKKKIDGLNAWVPSIQHQLALNFIHNQLVHREFRNRSISLRSVYDFYLLSGHTTDDQNLNGIRSFKERYNTYCYITSSTFNHPIISECLKNRTALRFKRTMDYLMNHPGPLIWVLRINSVMCWIIKIFKTLFLVPFSPGKRELIRNRLGSREARKEYLELLKHQF